MGNKKKGNKKQQTGGLQPKGGVYAAQKDAAVVIEGDVDPMIANARLREKAEKEKAKQKEAKKETKGKPMGWIGMGVGAVLGAMIGFVIDFLIIQSGGFVWGLIIGAVAGAIILGIVLKNLQKFKETGQELKKVRWPTLPMAIKKTGVVLGVVICFGIVVFLLDLGLGALYRILTSGY